MIADLAPRIPVLLLKTKSSPKDGYEDFFNAAADRAYTPIFVPVLEHRFNTDALDHIRTLISDGRCGGPNARYGGLIFTSQRAVEAFTIVIGELRASGRQLEEAITPDLPLYVVGPSTARALKALNLASPILGEESGNGDNLAQFILQDYNARWASSQNGEPAKPALLFLVGEQRRDVIPSTLQSQELDEGSRIEVDEVAVYETGELQSFKAHFARTLSANQQPHIACQWVAVFSPTGCRAMLECLGLIDPQTNKAKRKEDRQARTSGDARTFIATIGPTTRDYLRREFDYNPDVVAPKPSPEGLGEAIKGFMSSFEQIEG